MGVSYNPILAIGKVFEDSSEAEDFLREVGLLENVGDDDIYEDGLDEWLPSGLNGGCLNLYSGYGYYLGFRISCSSIESFGKDFDNGIKMWNSLFPDTPADVIHTVRVS